MGDALFQKKYTTDTLPFQRKINYGEKPQYYVEEVNEAIISREDFYAVQERLKSEKYERSMLENTRPLQRKIVCSCGKMYKPVFINEKYYWECCNKNNDIDKCQSRRIPQKDIFKAVVQKITFPSDTSICFELAGSLKITEKIPEQARCRRT